ncbi:amino acid permease [Aliarcobacter cryaerophilus]|uniref:amino acid permease n=1 Tax=Aliarcobacter cryaerophilus TaxID=28198 RepID=UPI003DA2849E
MDRQILYWTMSLFGTAIGAGILFLPITIGVGGVLSLVIMLFLAYPLIHYAHKLFSQYIYASPNINNFAQAVDDDFGKKLALFLTFSYFIEIFVVLLLYSVALTNSVELALKSNFNFELNRVLLSFIIVTILMLILSRGINFVIKVISYFVFIFIISILLLSFYMILHWDGGIFNEFNISQIKVGDISLAIIYAIPIMIFAFNHVAILSSMVIEQKKANKSLAEENINKILKYAHILIIVVVLFFVFSCSMSFTIEDFKEANSKNINILSYISSKEGGAVLHIFAPILAIIAISKSFLGHYMGAKEGFIGVIKNFKATQNISTETLNKFTFVFVALSSFLVAVLNPSVLDMINKIIAPLIAITLFLFPVYAVRRLEKMRKYRSITNYLVLIIGIFALLVIVYELL